MAPCEELSLRQQCELVGISRSGFYYQPCPESEENLALMRRLDELHLEHPVYGSRKLTVLLCREGLAVEQHAGIGLLCGRLPPASFSDPRVGSLNVREPHLRG